MSETGTVVGRVVEDPATARMLVAVYLNSDEEGLTCRADDATLCSSASLSSESGVEALVRLVKAGLIRSLVLPATHPRPGRSLVLMDHPASDWYLRETRRSLATIAAN